MTNFSEVINKIKSNYFDLLQKFKQQGEAIVDFELKISENEVEILRLKNELVTIQERLNEVEAERNRIQEQNSAQLAEITELNEALKNTQNVENIHVEEIVREIDDCINLIKNTL